MTVLRAREFLERLERDRHLQRQLEHAAPDDVHALVHFAGECGFHFDEEAFTVALQTFPKSRLAQKFDADRLRISPYERERHAE
jgi:hypothetical protein